MRAMLLERVGGPLELRDLPPPPVTRDHLRVRVRACAVCRTDLHILDGELPEPKRPLVPGHQVVGEVEAVGQGAEDFAPGARVGVPWLGGTCGACRYCRGGRENLCERARFTGYSLDGGYAELLLVHKDFCLRLPAERSDLELAPLLCAGLIGYRSLRMVGDAERLGLYGFGAAAHLVAQVARSEGRRIFAFTRAGDVAAQRFARELGCEWAGASSEAPPEPLDGALIFAPVGALVVQALQHSARGASVVCGGIHMSDIPSFPYELLWGERSVRSVANLTRRDGTEFFQLPIVRDLRVSATRYRLEDANLALADLRDGKLTGSAVLVP